MSVAYYGAFYAAKAVLAYHRVGAKTNKGVAQEFHRLAVAKSDFPVDIARLLGAMQSRRLSADYDLSKAVDDWREEDALMAIDQATAFIDEVEAWFHRHLQPGTL